MFLAMLFSTAAGLSALGRWPQARREAGICIGLLLVGGFVLGPLMQWYGFGAWWTGVPFGWDLTDNKTLRRRRRLALGGVADARRPPGPDGHHPGGPDHARGVRHPAQRVGVRVQVGFGAARDTVRRSSPTLP